MHTRSIIWRAVTAWMLWRARRRLRRAVPELAALSAKRAEIARGHRSGVAAIDKQMQRATTERLMHELGRA